MSLTDVAFAISTLLVPIPQGELGELHSPETHIIPLVIEAALGRRNSVEIFGLDYPTADSTAIRDFIHESCFKTGYRALISQ